MTDKVMRDVEAAVKHFDYLAGRWEDEHEYEDIADYVRSLETNHPKLKATTLSAGRYLALRVRHEDAPGRAFDLRATSSQITVREVAYCG